MLLYCHTALPCKKYRIFLKGVIHLLQNIFEIKTIPLISIIVLYHFLISFRIVSSVIFTEVVLNSTSKCCYKAFYLVELRHELINQTVVRT